MAKELLKGNIAMAEAAIQAGCRFFAGYPITPQNEVPEYMSYRMPDAGGVFIQSESEVAAINMIYGAAGAGVRAMTSSSSPGMSLKQEGISYIAGAELPCVILNVMRGGPGLGGIQPAQADYFQSVKGGGHGDYRLVVYAPASIQEGVDLIQKAFHVADKYRTPTMILVDGVIGQMMEPAEIGVPEEDPLPPKDWATTGIRGAQRGPNIINSLHLQPKKLEQHNLHLQAKYATIQENETMVEASNTENAEIVVVAYGTTARIVRSAVDLLGEEAAKVGLIRPITLFPFPSECIAKAAEKAKAFLTVEMSAGQMVEDVRLAVNGQRPVHFYGRQGGILPKARAIAEKLKEIKEGL